jgi:hypothetical protein
MTTFTTCIHFYFSSVQVAHDYKLSHFLETDATNMRRGNNLLQTFSFHCNNNSFILSSKVCPLYSGFASPKTKFRHLSLSLVSSFVSPWFVMLRPCNIIIITVIVFCFYDVQSSVPWWWRQYAPPKRRSTSTILRRPISQKDVVFTLTAHKPGTLQLFRVASAKKLHEPSNFSPHNLPPFGWKILFPTF